MLKAVASYLRLSLEDVDLHTNQAKDESNSILSQRRITEHFIASQPDLALLPRMEFSDDGYTGTNFQRPGFERLLQAVKAGEVGTVVVKDLSRFGRNYLEVGDYLEHIFPYLGVRLIAVNDQYDSQNNKGSTGGLDVAFRNLINDQYSHDISKKVKAGMRVHQKQARYVNCVPYGYLRSPTEKHQMVIDPEAAPIVRQIFLDMIDGKSTVQIAKALNDKGVPPPAVHKKVRRSAAQSKTPQWTHYCICSIVKNIKYTGIMVNHTRESTHLRDKCGRRTDQTEWIMRENAHEAIVSKEIFQAANDARYKVQVRERKASDPATRIFYCAHCGRKLRKTKGTDTYLSCPSSSYHSGAPCCAYRWSMTHMEEVLQVSLSKQLEVMQSAVGAFSSDRSQIQTLQQKLALLNNQVEHADTEVVQEYIRYRDGAYSREEYIARKQRLTDDTEALKAQVAETETQINQLRNQQKKRADAVKQASAIRELDSNVISENLYHAIERVTVWNNEKIEIKWSFSSLLKSQVF